MREDRARVLVVEDDADLRGILQETLKGAGYYVAALDDGRGALDAIRAQRPDVLVLDVVMAGVDGLQVLAEVRALGQPLPVLLITGLASMTHLIDGADAFLPKPFDLGVFVATVARLLDKAA